MILDQEVTIGGSSYSGYVVSIERRHCICDVMSTGSVVMTGDAPTALPYATIVIEEQGTKVFTGYVTASRSEAGGYIRIVDFADAAIKLTDYWLTTPLSANNETVQYWLQYFCDLAGVNCAFDTSLVALVPPPNAGEYSWYYTSVIDIIKELLVYAGYWMYSDTNGTIHFSQGHYVPITLSIRDGENILDSSRVRSITPTRNRAVVFGRGVTGESSAYVSEISDRTKTAIVATPYIVTVGQATSLATRLVNAFSRLKDEKTFHIEGNPAFTLAQFITVSDSFLNLSGNFQITEVRSSMSNEGYVMDIVLDQYCPKIWGTYDWENELLSRVYASTWGNGVYRSDNLGQSWYQLSSGLENNALYVNAVNADGDRAWAATKVGLYYLVGSGWEDRTPTVYPSGSPTTYWMDVEIDPSDVQITYALGKNALGMISLYKTENDGAVWDYVVIE